MQYINRLTEFIDIISNRPFLIDYEKESPSYLIKTNNLLKDVFMETEFVSNLTSIGLEDQKTLSNIIDNNVEYLYSYGYRVQQQNKKKKTGRLSFFYRGISNNTYPIVSGIYRSTEHHEENFYFNEISVRCPEAFRTLNNLEKLTYMQHYGCPTRLLDITSNPLVALYFACSDNEEQQGSVYVFAVDSEEVLYSDSDRVHVLAKLAEFKREEQEKLRLLAYSCIVGKKFSFSTNGKYKVRELEQFYHSIKRSHAEFEREIVPFDLLKPQFVQPNKDNPRILKQDGAFIISGLDGSDKESNMKIRKSLVEEIVIDPKYKPQIIQELEYVGINQATLFPEVDKVADYLRKRPY